MVPPSSWFDVRNMLPSCQTRTTCQTVRCRKPEHHNSIFKAAKPSYLTLTAHYTELTSRADQQDADERYTHAPPSAARCSLSSGNYGPVLWRMSNSQDRGNPTDVLARTPLLAEPNLHHLRILPKHEEDFTVSHTSQALSYLYLERT